MSVDPSFISPLSTPKQGFSLALTQDHVSDIDGHGLAANCLRLSCSLSLSLCSTNPLLAQMFEVENHPFCRRVLAARQADKLLPKVEIHENVETLTGRKARASGAKGLGGGFPCQACRRL